MRQPTGKDEWADDVAATLRRRAESLAHEGIDEATGVLVGLLLFRLGDEWYSVKVEDVREIYREYEVTAIPCTPASILGVVNIRGEMVSVTDIAKLMGLGQFVPGAVTAPAVVIQNEEVVTAIVVDEIGDIIEVAEENIEPPLSIIDRVNAQFIIGSVYHQERLIGVVNANSVLVPIGSAK
ncbi:MAG: chemotaxis protein CheW [Actinobacteria bacterium]|nr:chemotaxis protein CheW [Actinomycetota bacterium]MCL5887047.1 chemotaxis protein CheW [Actinomycetota bacterium]